MRSTIVGIILAAALAYPTVTRAVENPFIDREIMGPASYMQSPFSPLANPALADQPSAPYIAYMADAYDVRAHANHRLVLNTWGFTLSRSWLRESCSRDEKDMTRPDAGTFTVGKGILFGDVFGIGAAYTYSWSSEYAYDRYRALEYGLVFQPTRFISFGYVMKDANRPRIAGERLPRTGIYSVSLRPFHEYLTLSCDVFQSRSERLAGSDTAFSAELLLGGVSVLVRRSAWGAYSFGVQMPLSPQAGGPSTLIAGVERAPRYSGAPGRNRVSVALSGEGDRDAPSLQKSVLRIDINRSLGETAEDRLFRETPLTFHEVLGSIREAAEDDGIEAIFMRITGSELGFAQVQELRDEVKRFRSRGKKVRAMLMNADNKSYYLAAAAGEVYLAPSEHFALTGLSAQVYFFKTVLEKIGVRVESVRHGKYKSFNEPFTRDGMSDEYRENLMTLLTDLNVQFLNDLLKDRGVSKDKMDELFARGFMTPGEAQEAGFIDGVLYPDEALDKMKEDGRAHGAVLECMTYARGELKNRRWGTPPAVAVVHVNGSIVQDGEGAGGFTGDTISDDQYTAIIERVFADHSIGAVVIRIDSGGGSAAASDSMWHALAAAKKKYGKPVVFSFGNIAASGGYYIACTGDKIYSMPGTVTGSIGVISGKLSLQKLYEMLGIRKEVIKMSEFADIFSESRDLTAREREVLQRGVEFTYENFTGKVADARKIDRKDIPVVAEGRVFSGDQAKEKSLVDEAGGLMAALEAARGSAGIDGECRVLHFPHRESQLMQFIGAASAPEGRLARLLKPVTGTLKGFYFGNDPYLYLVPYRIDIR